MARKQQAEQLAEQRRQREEEERRQRVMVITEFDAAALRAGPLSNFLNPPPPPYSTECAAASSGVGKRRSPRPPPLFRIRNPQEYAASLAHVRLTTSDSFPSGRSTRHILGARWCAAPGLRAVSISLSPLLVYPAAPRFALAANAF
jgi:hypothetical protein